MGRRTLARRGLATAVVVSLLVLVAFAVAPAEPEPMPSPTVTPFHSATSGAATTEASIEHEGIKVSVTLSRAVMPAGEETVATVELRNTGLDDVVWLHDGCRILVLLEGRMSEMRWRPGVLQVGRAAAFKDLALERPAARWPAIEFVPEHLADERDITCSDVGTEERIPAGQTLTQRAVWSGYLADDMGPPPAGQVVITGLPESLRREEGGQVGSGDEMIVRLEAEIVRGRVENLLDPPQVVDAALADERVAQWLAAPITIGAGVVPVLRYKQQLTAWEVGLIDYRTERVRLAVVHPISGAVLDVVDRPWDPELDGFP